MKKFLFGLLFISSIFSANAQTYPGVPQFGTALNQDNTGRALTYHTTNIQDTLGATIDTLLIIPRGFEKDYFLTLKDSCVIAISNVNSSWTGSTMNIIIAAPSNTCTVKFLGWSGLATQWKMLSGTNTLTPTQGHFLILHFFCTGTAWIETSVSQD